MTDSGERHLPRLNTVKENVSLEYSELDPRRFQPVLLDPLAVLLHRPAKQVRARLVLAGHAYGASLGGRAAPSRARRFASLLEEMHAGSLVIDDIQDNSELRRGSPSLHRTHGVPVALNAGNWLYFWQLYQLRELGLPPERELELTQFCLDTYLKAHYGQSLDVGYRADTLPRSDVGAACIANMELKTGALLALALGAGALLAEAPLAPAAPLLSYGRALGIYLQMFDDIGNVTNPELGPKRYEDFRGRRLTWVWASAARNLSDGTYALFVEALRAGDDRGAHNLLENMGVLESARREARAFLAKARTKLHYQTPAAARSTLPEIESIETLLTGAYEKT